MKPEDNKRIQYFLTIWKGSQGNERANYQNFFRDLCDALGVTAPPPKGNVFGDPYCFDKEIKFFHSDRDSTTRFADFYKEGHLLVEAKQGSDISGKGTAKRGTETYRKAMEKAFFQARAYVKQLDVKPPFLITCDIGSHFELWMDFSGSYSIGYGARERLDLDDLLKPDVFDRFVAIFTDPQSLNPERYRARVTRDVAAELAKLAKWLEEQRHDPHEVANFLMRCIFTMFAEDVGLLPREVFKAALNERWIADPKRFKPEIENLWQTMNTGGSFGFERILRFNGSFFADATAFELPKEQLETLFRAANKDWSQVEPAIFGTLLERALDTKERSRLGAHYTPRSYVERLVRPVVIDSIRQEWQQVEMEVDRLLKLDEGQEDPTAAQKKKAEVEIRAFLKHLREIKILDPACGSGNFLYVTLDLLKTLEAEVMQRLVDVVGAVQLETEQVNPSQFLGIEVNPRAAAIAELVIWIGYLQWHFKRYGTTPPPEPVLQNFHNIEHRDAVLAYDGREEAIDPKTGKVKTRWGGRTMKHPATGEDVPDPSDQIPIYRYINPRPAEWQEADYIVSNPPFIGNARMRERLGDGYVEALRSVYRNIPESVDYVMYWWDKSASLLQEEKIDCFGFITTNSLRQTFNRRIISPYIEAKKSISIIFAIPDHPWVDASDGAAVRISMTSALKGQHKGLLSIVTEELSKEDGESVVKFESKLGSIFSNLSIGADITSTKVLKANEKIGNRGVQLIGSGFAITSYEAKKLGLGTVPNTEKYIRRYRNGRDITDKPRDIMVIDLFGLSEDNVKSDFPLIYQWILERVKPEREQNNRACYRKKWWIFGEPVVTTRNALEGLDRYIVTCRTAKHRVFTFLKNDIVPDAKLVTIALNDSSFLGILSSRIHLTWVLRSGAWLGVGNDSNYNHSECFNKFPFPDLSPEQKQKICELGEKLDAHRKGVQVQHPDVTITGMYNLLEKLRRGEPFTDSDRTYNDKALVSTLKQIHDDLDIAVFEAYGWQPTLSDDEILEKLVALNIDRAEEERNGLVRWLRPDYQAPGEAQVQQTLTGVMEPETAAIEPAEQRTWSKQPKEQLAAIQELLSTSQGEWTVDQLAAQFKGGARAKKAIKENLERLEFFGYVICRTDEVGVIRWQFVEMQKTA
ncbi:class I SAM-dependent DNA methyltransferase [Leptolyngbya sp. NIES-2104]|uniref:class I SAM-dependent DNA methyltransferase n=1 Tax=Leptolyngbya sp. NIES-2104 TaxID=1552121 RepID=UPI0006ECC68E|nr:DNA methyltransferase [Leptolyngbya sp. NIES-2104]GAQ00199.1 hypothetical protein NIES2104_67640 [Leptolyngbya sp. NIES-2104]